MSSDGVAIRVRDVSKHYLLFNQPQDRLKQSIIPRLQRLAGRKPTQYYRDFAALNHVSFEVRRGETVGVIGRNGSGKSTLLQIVCGTLRANSGTVEVHGRIAALLELGAGFNPEFTGRENVYLNAAILGLSRGEVAARFDEIARFADIGDFIDQPVKTYSSGMYVRLAFATAINVDPDILVVDEALAVGDEAFQRKCFARIEQIQERGGTILFVTHGVQTVVQLCTRALLFDHGELLLDGPPKLVTTQYQRLVNSAPEATARIRQSLRELGESSSFTAGDAKAVHSDDESKMAAAPRAKADSSMFLDTLISTSATVYGIGGCDIRDLRILSPSGKQVNLLLSGITYTYEYSVEFHQSFAPVSFGTMIKTVSGLELGGTSTEFWGSNLQRADAGTIVRVRLPFNCILAPGAYFFNAGIGTKINGEWTAIHRVFDALMFRVISRDEPQHSGTINFGFVPEVDVIVPSGASQASPSSAIERDRLLFASVGSAPK